jgi:hypothetical protein
MPSANPNWKAKPHLPSLTLVIALLSLALFALFVTDPVEIAAQEEPTPVATITLKPTRCAPNHATFVRDVTIADGKTLKRNEVFIKTWRVRNTGACAWTEGYSILFLEGLSNLGADSAPLPLAEAGQEVDISLKLVSPSQAGPYQGVWGLFDSAGQQFGTPLIVSISVSPDLAAATSTPTIRPAVTPVRPSPKEQSLTPASTPTPTERATRAISTNTSVPPAPTVTRRPSARPLPVREAIPTEMPPSESFEQIPTESSQRPDLAFILMVGSAMVVVLGIPIGLIVSRRKEKLIYPSNCNHS